MSALLLGGIGGTEALTKTINMTIATVDNIDHTQCMVGISSAVGTNEGVAAWATIVPRTGENARRTVTKVSSAPENQF